MRFSRVPIARRDRASRRLSPGNRQAPDDGEFDLLRLVMMEKAAYEIRYEATRSRLDRERARG